MEQAKKKLIDYYVEQALYTKVWTADAGTKKVVLLSVTESGTYVYAIVSREEGETLIPDTDFTVYNVMLSLPE